MRKLLLCGFLLFSTLLFAENIEPATGFNVKLANQQLITLQKTLAQPHTSIDTYQNAIESIESMLNEAAICTEESQKELDNIDVYINQSKKTAEPSSADLIYLDQQQKKWANIQAECRLFTIHAIEEINDERHAIITLREKATLTRSVPVWTLYQNFITSPTPTISQNLNHILSSNNILSPVYYVMSLCSAFILAPLILWRFRKTAFSKRFLHFKQIKPLYLGLLSCSLALSIILSPLLINFFARGEFNALMRPLGLLWIYCTSWFLLIFIFKANSFRSLLQWYNLNYRFARAVFFFIITAFILAALGQWLVDMQVYSLLIWQILKTTYLDCVLLTCFAFIFYYCHSQRQRHWVKKHAIGFQMTCALILGIPIALGSMGYLTLSIQLLYAGFILLTILFFMTAIVFGSEKLYRYIYRDKKLKQKIISYFGYKETQTFTEFLILKIATQLIVLIFGLFLIIKTSGFSTETIELSYEQFITGIHLGSITLYPTRIFLGIVVFCILYLALRAISTKISGHQQFEDEEETQIAVASLLTYIGFAIAFIIASLIAGFDFTGLAIIAGALSVGIGLGLQSIVNNFVSGLILLIEKPIKPGDRIAIDNVEGIVKKIRVRSTQIMTNAREDIIIPNSNLITQSVVNFMLTDKYCRITFNIEAAYTSEPYFVRDTLLDIANQHEDVIKTERNKPAVLLSEFGPNGLIFQLTCLIKDVNKKSLVRSDINFEINRVFKEKNIIMPLVQREIHIRKDN